MVTEWDAVDREQEDAFERGRSAGKKEAALETRVDWRPIDSAPTDRFILLYCHEDNSRWLAKWQSGVWYGVDVEHGIRREGHSWGDSSHVTGWFVSQWADVPAGPMS